MDVPFLLSKHDDERARSDALLMARPLTEEEIRRVSGACGCNTVEFSYDRESNHVDTNELGTDN